MTPGAGYWSLVLGLIAALGADGATAPGWVFVAGAAAAWASRNDGFVRFVFANVLLGGAATIGGAGAVAVWVGWSAAFTAWVADRRAQGRMGARSALALASLPLAGLWLYLATPIASNPSVYADTIGYGAPGWPAPGRVARVWGQPDETRWRMRALDEFDGERWRSSGRFTWTEPVDGASVAVVEAGPRAAGLALSPWAGAVPQGGALVDRDGNVIPSREPWYVLVPGAAAPPTIRHLAVPADVVVQLQPIVSRWGGLDPRRRVTAMTRALRDSGVYDPALVVGDLTNFLELRRGTCQHFASTLALMLRVSGVPSRVVTGFLVPPATTSDGYREVRGEAFHAWVEAWVDGRWRAFDPTPPAPPPVMVQDVEEVIAEVDRWDRGAFQEVRWWVLAWPVGALAVAAAAGARAWRSLRPVDAASAWRWARQEAERRVGGAPAGLPDVEAARWLGSRWPDAASILEELAWESHRARFGSGDLGAWRGLVTRLRDRLARTPE